MLRKLPGKWSSILRSAGALGRGQSKSKGGGRLSIHCTASEPTIESIFRTISSANQLSMYGAVADLCKESGDPPFCSDKTCAIKRKTEVLIKSTDLLTVQSPLQTSDQE